MNLRLALNLYGAPAVLIAVGTLLASINKPSHPALAALDHLILRGALGFFIVGAAWIAYSTWTFWQASRGVGELCHNCAMPTRLIDPGRYGPYFKCMACGANRRAHF